MFADLFRTDLYSKAMKSFLALGCVVSLAGCDLAMNYTKTDRAANMDVQDYRDAMAERLPETGKDTNKAAEYDSIPDLQPYVQMTSTAIEAMPLVSVSVNQSVPVKDVLYELAQQAEYDIELDPNIRGSIIFTARNKPFDQVVHRISKIAGLRYKFEDSFLRVEVDTPYNKTYKVDYLSFIRSNQGTVSSSVSVVSGEGADTGSNYSASSDSVSDFWGELEANLGQILGGASRTLKTNRDPRISAVEQNPQVAAVSPTQGEGNVQVQPPEAVLRVDSLPVDDSQDQPSAGGEEGNGYTFSLNKQAGMISVYANERAHEEVESYLKSLRRSVTSQVLVEAKVFEVSLKDEYINGIEWSVLTENAKGLVRFVEGTDVNNVFGAISTLGGDVAAVSNFGVGYVGGDVAAFVEAISGFGTVRALASPRLTVLNNQSAVLNVATNRVFFDLDLDREEEEDGAITRTTLEIDSEIKSVPEGVLINVQPSIDLENRTVSMFIRPTVTRVVGTVQDPAVQFLAEDSGIVSEIPEVNVQEIDTVVKVNSGQPIVMGGLLQDRAFSNQEKVPVAGEIPVLGALFGKQKDLVTKTELVIFLKATLIENGNDTIHNTDRDLYKVFSADRRPLDL